MDSSCRAFYEYVNFYIGTFQSNWKPIMHTFSFPLGFYCKKNTIELLTPTNSRANFTFVLLIIITLTEKRNVYGLHLHGNYWVKTLAIIKAAKSQSVWNFARRINHSNVCKIDRNYDSRTQNRFNPLIDFWREC